ncbi:MAG: phosphoribosyltransferase family protein, partial [Chitinophagales bacterium]|nr:phosphoribosyltransferase family protein [Chitinophagales bacterium]
FLGKLLGRKMKENMPCQYDTIIPVPLHPQRMLERGYNQAKMFALGLSEVLECEVAEDILIRSKASPTQTKKTLFERLDNVANIFEIKDSARLNDKHILLVDDVLTTGATIESCANELIKAGTIRLSIATIAVA